MRIRGKVVIVAVCAAALFFIASAFAANPSDLRLVEAVKNKDKDAIHSLLQEGVDVNIPQGDGATALAWAAHWDDIGTAETLIVKGATVDAANEYGVTPLSLACVNGSQPMVELLLKAGANPNVARVTGETPLMTAARSGSLAVVKTLLSHGANVNAQELRRGQTALMWALAEGHHPIVRALIEAKADIHARSNHGFTPLLFAAQQGDRESAQILLAAGADVNERTPEDGSALVVAAASGHEQFAIFLLESGADPNAANAYGLTALHYAVRRGLAFVDGVRYDPELTYLFQPNMRELAMALLARGANPNARITKAPPIPGARRLPVISLIGATPYLLAAGSYDADLMRLLVAKGADASLAAEKNTTALILAAGLAEGLGYVPARTQEDEQHALEAVKLAVELGAKVNEHTQDGQTPLHGAAYVGANEIIRFLAARGADVNAADRYGQTPLTISEKLYPPGLLDDNLRPQFVHKETADLLVELGARPVHVATQAAGPSR